MLLIDVYMKKALFIYRKLPGNTGGGIVTDSYYKVLANVFKDNLFLFELLPYEGNWQKFIGYLRGNPSRQSDKICYDILELICKNNIDIVFVNASLYGKIISFLYKRKPILKIIIFYHNIETLFVRSILKRQYRLSHFLAYVATYFSERKVTNLSSYRIGLNERDSECLYSLFGRKMDLILPLSMEDKFDESKAIIGSSGSSIGLFVGSDFFANYYGIKWFIENVSPYISATIKVVGRGLEKYSKTFTAYKNIQIIGTVDSLSAYYYEADFVISPIFDGSGMKTKTAEALMYGKTIIGTSEAFEGYKYNKNIGFVCNDSESFISVINSNVFMKYNKYSRSLFLSYYSFHNMENEINKLVDKL